MRSEALVIVAVCALGAAIRMDDKALFFRADLDKSEEDKIEEESPEVRLSRQAAMDPKIRSILEFIQDQYMDMRKKKSANTDPKYLLLSPSLQPSLHYIPVQTAPSKSRTQSFSPADNSAPSVEINQELSGYTRDNPEPDFPIVSPQNRFSIPKPGPTSGHSSGSSAGFSSSQQTVDNEDVNFVTRPGFSTPQSDHRQRDQFSSPRPRPLSQSSQSTFSSTQQDDSQDAIFSNPSPRPVFQSSKPTISSRQQDDSQDTIFSNPSPRPVFQSSQPTFSRPKSSNPSPKPSISSSGDGFSSPRPFNPAPSGSEASNSVHPPHIHEIGVECAKDKMTINIEFDRVFDGEIYAKGYYKECRFVSANSGQKKYSFTVSLNSCGTAFVERFKEGGQAYLENILVLQNEPGIQEVWDTIRSVRCLWEGSIKKALTSALSVDMLSQETVTFSGDTAVAKLDIQMGRGPLAPVANGLVKIGEMMTLVVSVEGDPDFDIHVRDCMARDESSDNVVQLTDDDGCILKPKLIGAFQKTRDTGNSGASVMAYAYFHAFKFPEIMDLTLDCNVELCKTDCEMCPDTNQSIEPGRRRRSVDNNTLGEPARISRSFRIVAAEDFAFSMPTSDVSPLVDVTRSGICLSMPGFVLASVLLISVLFGSCSLSGYWWLKAQKAGKGLA